MQVRLDKSLAIQLMPKDLPILDEMNAMCWIQDEITDRVALLSLSMYSMHNQDPEHAAPPMICNFPSFNFTYLKEK